MVDPGNGGPEPRGVAKVVNFWALNANSSKISKDTNFKFATHAPTVIPVMTPEIFFRKGDVARVT